MLDLRLDPKLPKLVAEAFVREARKAGVALADMELMSIHAPTVRAFLDAVRRGEVRPFLDLLDRPALEARFHPAPAPAPRARGVSAP